MKKIIFVLILINCTFIYSQNDPIDEMNVIPKNIEYKNCVKEITITNFFLSNSKGAKDTTKAISIVNFSKKGLIQQIKSYYSTYGNSWKTTVFDKFGRVTTISKKQDNNLIPFVDQYFSNDTKFPDSTIIKSNKNYVEKYNNIFIENQLIRQNHYINGSLEDYRTYRYNKNNQLIEEFYHNSDNPAGETMVSSLNDNSYRLSFYPNQQTLYEYYTKKDTNVVVKIQPKSSRKEIIKKLNNRKYFLEIMEVYYNSKLDEFKSIYTSNTMILKTHNRYNKNKQINNYYNTIETDTSYVVKYTTYENQPENTFKTDIEVVYDKFNNWIKKTYSRNKIIDNIIDRKIEYYCH